MKTKHSDTDSTTIIQMVNNGEDIVIGSKKKSESNFLNACDELLKQLTVDYKRNKEDILKLKKMYQHSVKNSEKAKQKKKHSGITKPQLVPKDLCKLLDLDQNNPVYKSRIEITKEIYELLHSRGLYYQQDKRVLRADEEIKKIFNLPDTVNNSIDPKDKQGFNFYTLQSYIKQCYNK